MAPPLIALDFDGVLCDSAGETAVSAWYAGSGIWSEWQGDPPRTLVDRFRQLRPALETGYQAVPLLRAAASNRSVSDILENASDIVADIMRGNGLTPDDLKARFAAARDEWIRRDPESWLASHRFYPGVLERVQNAMCNADVIIVTTKQERFVNRLLEKANLPFPADSILGLDRGRPKEVLLEERLSGPAPPSAAHLVEDRLATLERLRAVPALHRLQLYLAAWGYNTEPDHARARDLDIPVWQLKDFLVALH